MRAAEVDTTYRDLPNLRHLRAFSMTARHRSVKKTADEIYLSQPAVTQAIGNLEDQFGQIFFERSARGMFLTEVGEIFLRRVDRALTEIGRACQSGGGQAGRKNRAADPMRLLSSAQIRVIIAIADHGNFTMAANALGLSRPSIQRTARTLEKSLNYKIFLRSSRGIGLSVAGEQFARRAKLAAREIELAREEIEQFHGQKVGRMVIGSLPLSLIDLVPTALMHVLDQLPDLNICIVEGPYEGQLDALRNGEIDMLVGALRDPAPCADVVQRELFDDRLSVVARAGHPLMKHGSLTLSDAVGYAWVVPRKETPTRRLFHQAFARRALAEPKRLLEVSSHSSLRALLTGSDRIALISRRQIRYEEEGGMLCALPIDLPDTVRTIGVTTRADWEPSAAQKLLISELTRMCAELNAEIGTPNGVSKTRKDISRASG